MNGELQYECYSCAEYEDEIERLRSGWRETLMVQYALEPRGGTIRTRYDSAEDFADAVIVATLAQHMEGTDEPNQTVRTG